MLILAPRLLALLALMAMVSLLGGVAYRRVWLRVRGDVVTPTGFGAFLALYLMAGAILFGAAANLIAALGVTIVGTIVYWVDDLRELSARLRFAIQYGSGAAIVGLVLYPVIGGHIALFVALCLAGGLVNIVLVQITNFYDGADLNLGLTIALTAAAMLIYLPGQPVLGAVALSMLAFILPFSLLNRTPRTLYLGDSGAFSFACLLLLATLICLSPQSPRDLLVAAPMALPTFDVFFVLVLRWVRRENYFTRNYHHLYQRLQIERGGVLYLAPQVINPLLVIAAAAILRGSGLNADLAAIIALLAVTIAFYFTCRHWLLKREAVA